MQHWKRSNWWILAYSTIGTTDYMAPGVLVKKDWYGVWLVHPWFRGIKRTQDSDILHTAVSSQEPFHKSDDGHSIFWNFWVTEPNKYAIVEAIKQNEHGGLLMLTSFKSMNTTVIHRAKRKYQSKPSQHGRQRWTDKHTQSYRIHIQSTRQRMFEGSHRWY